jgi:hypothetical protein
MFSSIFRHNVWCKCCSEWEVCSEIAVIKWWDENVNLKVSIRSVKSRHVRHVNHSIIANEETFVSHDMLIFLWSQLSGVCKISYSQGWLHLLLWKVLSNVQVMHAWWRKCFLRYEKIQISSFTVPAHKRQTRINVMYVCMYIHTTPLHQFYCCNGNDIRSI